MLRDIKYKPSYSKAFDDIASEFYLPTMREANRYDRATGYFSSSIYLLCWSSLKDFINRGGVIRLLCSPYLSEADQQAIDEGKESFSSASEEQERLFKEFQDIFSKDELSAPERVLACLISSGKIEIKIAVGKEDPNRLFHDKVGVFFSGDDAVAFRGSINETFKGLSDDGNFESFDVFTNWGQGNDKERTDGIISEFERIWDNKAEKIRALEIPQSIKTLVRKHAISGKAWEESVDEVVVSLSNAKKWAADKSPKGKKPREHQWKALDNWAKQGYRGIFEHATGSGKTYTAICAIKKEIDAFHPVLVLVPSVGLLNQWRTEIEANIHDEEIHYLLCGDGNNDWRNNNALRTWTRPNSSRKRIIIATMDTASSFEFRSRIVQSPELLVVGDEVHRMGSAGNQEFFSVNAGKRLGLSATPKRYRDEQGTRAIISYFGDIIQPPYTLQDAIKAGVLTRYFYHPTTVKLTDSEQQEWNDISKKISEIYARIQSSKDGDEGLQKKIDKLLIERSRITKNASGKLQLALKIIQQYYHDEPKHKWIVYCDNHVQLSDVLSLLRKNNYRAYEYHSRLDKEKQRATLDYFAKVGGIIVSIKCLDEGINIPSASHALILASSQNPREYIQRRGRVLRLSEGKHFAYIFDAIVLPDNIEENDKYDRIVATELARAIQFGEGAEDKSCITHLKIIANNHNIEYDNVLLEGGFEDE